MVERRSSNRPPSMPPAVERIAPGTTIGSYTIVRMAGEGGMGQVYEAIQRSLKRQVAIKVLAQWAAARSDLRARFLREGEVAARIRHHNIVEVYDVGVWENGDGERPYLVMEYLEGMTLDEKMRRVGMFSEEETAEIMLPVLSAVAAAHDRGVVHRDLKPENIFLAQQDSGMVPKILDFGISRIVTARMRLTVDAEQIGTPHYMSPEQARGEPVDARSDQYSLGVVLYEMVTGMLPRDHESPLKLLQLVGNTAEFTSPSEHVPSLGAEIERVVLRSMSFEPKARYSDLKDMALDLATAAAPATRAFWEREFGLVSGSVKPEPDGDTEPDTQTEQTIAHQSPPSRRSAWLGLALLLVLLIGGGAWAAFSGGPDAEEVGEAPSAAAPPAATPPASTESMTSLPPAETPVSPTAVEPAVVEVEPAPDPAVELPAQPATSTMRAPFVRMRAQPRIRPEVVAAEPDPAPAMEESAPAMEPAMTEAPVSPMSAEWRPRVQTTDNIDPWN